MKAERPLREAIRQPAKGFPKFKNSSESNQSFTWNNQGCSIKNRRRKAIWHTSPDER